MNKLLLLLCIFFILSCQDTSSESYIKKYKKDSFDIEVTIDTIQNIERFVYYLKGKKDRAFSEKNGIINGLTTFYHTNGNIKASCNYINGKLNGKYSFFDMEGNLEEFSYYKNDLKDGLSKSYNNLGKEVIIAQYRKGGIIYRRDNKYSQDMLLDSVIEDLVVTWSKIADTVSTIKHLSIELSIPYINYYHYQKDSFCIEMAFERMDNVEKYGLTNPKEKYKMINGSTHYSFILPKEGSYLIYGRLMYKNDKLIQEVQRFEKVVYANRILD